MTLKEADALTEEMGELIRNSNKSSKWFLYLADSVDLRSGPVLEITSFHERQPGDNGIIHCRFHNKGLSVETVLQLPDKKEVAA